MCSFYYVYVYLEQNTLSVDGDVDYHPYTAFYGSRKLRKK